MTMLGMGMLGVPLRLTDMETQTGLVTVTSILTVSTRPDLVCPCPPGPAGQYQDLPGGRPVSFLSHTTGGPTMSVRCGDGEDLIMGRHGAPPRLTAMETMLTTVDTMESVIAAVPGGAL